MPTRLEEQEALLHECTVEVTDDNGKLLSVGFFITPGYVMTTSHGLRGKGVVWLRPPGSQSDRILVRQVIIGPKDSDPSSIRYVHPDIAILRIDALERQPCVPLETNRPGSGDVLLCLACVPTGNLSTVYVKCTAQSSSARQPLLELKGVGTPLMAGAAVLNTRTGSVCAVIGENPDANRIYAIPCQEMSFDLGPTLNLLGTNWVIHNREIPPPSPARMSEPPWEVEPYTSAQRKASDNRVFDDLTDPTLIDNAKDFARALGVLRSTSGVTIANLAQEADISQGAVVDILGCRALPSEQVLLKLLTAFDVTSSHKKAEWCAALMKFEDQAFGQRSAPPSETRPADDGIFSETMREQDSPTITPPGWHPETPPKEHGAQPYRPYVSRRLPSATGGARDSSSSRGQVAAESDEIRVEETVSSSGSQEPDQPDLLFRVFIPSERLYAAEAGRLLSLFRDWITATRGHGIRQSEHWKPTGTIYEFFADASVLQPDLRAEFDNFSDFLTLCSEDAPAAAEVITSTGVDRTTSVNLVARFGKEVRRLKKDLRHDREQRMLAIRQDLEDELEEMGVDLPAIPSEQMSALIDSQVPYPSPGESLTLLAVPWPTRAAIPGIVMNNPQFINAVQGTIIHSVRGDARLGLQAREFLDFIGEFGGQEIALLQSAVYELENKHTPNTEQSKAKACLKKFLGGLAGTAKDVGTDLLAKYMESKGF